MRARNFRALQDSHMAAAKVVRLPKRSQIKTADTWDLSRLFARDNDWEEALIKLEKRIKGYEKFRDTLADGAEQLAACLKYDSDTERLADRVSNYAYLKTAEDQANSTYQRMLGRIRSVGTRVSEAASFIQPELMAISDAKMKSFLAHEAMAKYRLLVERILRYKPHTLGKSEERLLAMQGEMAGTPSVVFRQLHDADLKFGLVKDESGRQIELSPATLGKLLQSPSRDVRRNAFHQFYEQFKAHENSLAAILHGSIQKDVYYARARSYESCLHGALFADKVPISVYDNLVKTVRKHLPAVHRYYQLRRAKMKLRDIHHYDTYVPILSEIKQRHTWEQASRAVVDALEPLGEEYCRVLDQGLRGRWCDRYPNQGKQSGAFSSGCYDSDPYILMNFKPEVLDDVFTLAHEAGHSMHSHLSIKHQPFEYHSYTIFVAEVASTFNEQLLTRHLLDRAKDDRQRAYLINNEIDDIRSTIVRQTMFAEFERTTHAMVESGEPLTIEAFKKVYRQLLEDYFGPEFVLDEELSLECLRIPHFYRAFYVYKYATGLSAAIALSERVLHGGPRELGDYLGFLQGGCSKYPLDLLRGAGVDLEKPQPVDLAMRKFTRLVDRLDELLD
jgi:oligoendopeptidase F